MNSEQQQIAEQIRNGQYFKDARSWYATLYIGPIAERTFFLLVLVLAGLTAFIGFIGFMRFLPLTERVPFLLAASDAEREVPYLERLRDENGSIESGMEGSLLREYVERRESYGAAFFDANMAFVRAHSEASLFNAYEAVYGRSNARSPVNVLRESGRRLVTIESVDMLAQAETGGPQQAVVKFSTALEGLGTQAKTKWTATLSYYYIPMRITEGAVGANGEPGAPVVENPQFKVVSYAISQTP